jgi:hypothetical protein
VVAVGLSIDPIDLRLYTMAQASLAGTLLLCAALAATTIAPRLVLTVLGLNALLHLLLDATEVKWGNGVHLFAPFAWRMTSFDLVAGESTLMLALTIAGTLGLALEIARPRVPVVGLDLRPRRLAAAAALLAAYLLAPLPFLDAVEGSDSYSVKTLRDVAGRLGRAVSLDRTAFLAPDLLRVDRLVEHQQDGDWPSYVALSLLALVWTRSLWPPRCPPRRSRHL